VSDRLTRTLASTALAVALLALVLSGYALYAQQRSEENLRRIGHELQRALAPSVLPMNPPPPSLDRDDT
jgi:hypothetical protein